MKRVSHQGLTLSASQRRHLDLQARMRAVQLSPLRAEVDQCLRELDERAEQGIKAEPLYKVTERSKGTPSIAEWMGF